MSPPIYLFHTLTCANGKGNTVSRLETSTTDKCCREEAAQKAHPEPHVTVTHIQHHNFSTRQSYENVEADGAVEIRARTNRETHK